MTRFARTLAVALLAGTVLLGAGAAVHPMLSGDAAAQLHLIATTPYWRAIHLMMLAGSALIVAGVWVRLLDRTGPAAAAAIALVALGFALNALNIAYMAGAGTHMAALFDAGRSEMSAVFEATHPIGLMAARFGNFIVALGAVALGWAEWQDATRPRWLAALAWVAAAGGFVGVIFFNEASPLTLAAVALLSGWQVATGVRALGIGPRA